MDVIAELWNEVVFEATHEWSTLLIELVQFAILLFIIKAVAFGIGSRRGMIPNMLEARRERVLASLKEAAERERGAEVAPSRADAILVSARADANEMLASARESAAAERVRILEEADAQAEELMRQATETLEHERAEVLGGVRDVLLDIVANGTRQVLDEGYSVGQQKEMIQAAILESIDDLESVAIE